jgi:hypothetical protein
LKKGGKRQAAGGSKILTKIKNMIFVRDFHADGILNMQ